MATATETASQSIISAVGALTPQAPGPHRLFAEQDVKYGDWRDELVQNGFTVVKGAIPRDRADQYADDILSYLENL